MRIARFFSGTTAVLALVCGLLSGACVTSPAAAVAPNSHCADLVAKAVTSYSSVKGSANCFEPGDTSPVADSELSDFTVYPPPVFDRIDHACGFHRIDSTFGYLVSNRTDQAAGQVIVLVNTSGMVRDVAKHLVRAPGDPTGVAVTCPAAATSYTFHS